MRTESCTATAHGLFLSALAAEPMAMDVLKRIEITPRNTSQQQRDDCVYTFQACQQLRDVATEAPI